MWPFRRRSIRARIALYGGATIAITLLIFGIALHLIAQSGITTDQENLLRRRAEETVSILRTVPVSDFAPHTSLTALDLRAAARTDNGDTFVAVLDRSGQAIASTGLIDGQPPAFDPATLAIASANGSLLTTVESSGLGLRVYIVPWRRDDLGRDGFVVAGQTANQIRRQLVGFRVLITITSILVLLGALVPIWRVAGRALRPLGTMATTVDEIGQTRDLSRRLTPLGSGDDLDRLTASFNSMLERLEEAQSRLAGALEAQRRFVADASHELRTPLTTIRSNAGFLLARPDVAPSDREAALHDIAAESERMSRLVTDLLTLARADSGYHTPKAPLDLAALVQDCCRQAQRLHTSRDIVLLTSDAADESPLMTFGNRDTLTQLLWIVLDNAVKHTLRGGRIEIDLNRLPEVPAARLTVRDDGVGIPEPDLPHIFERFHQADRARSSGGAGLGLSIARWIIDDHGGTISAANNPTHGARFAITLPLLAAGEPASASDSATS